MITQLGNKEWLKRFNEALGKLKINFNIKSIIDFKVNIKSQYFNQLQIVDTIKILKGKNNISFIKFDKLKLLRRFFWKSFDFRIKIENEVKLLRFIISKSNNDEIFWSQRRIKGHGSIFIWRINPILVKNFKY